MSSSFRFACDSLVALPPATGDGATIFAKNSDRPAGEAQPLCFVPRQSHAPGTRLKTQYIEIDQVAETAQIIGSRPFWLWGFEHGLNEFGVAIGNHTVFTKDGLEGKGLIGMDLVRLGLERGRTAVQALEAIIGLIERHGQGGSGYVDKDWPYHNSFLIADCREAFVLETSDRRWAWKRVRDIGSASNHVSITTDWEGLAADAIAHAVQQGWWPEGASGRFDFAAAYRDTSMAPEIISSARYGRTCALLGEGQGHMSVAGMRSALRDHYDLGPVFKGKYAPDEANYYSVCMHADPVGTTTASVVARLPVNTNETATYWASLGSPCLGTFVPLYVEVGVPEVLTRGGEEPSADSAWWRFKALLTAIEREPGRAPQVRRVWDEFEAALVSETARVEAEANRLRAAGEDGRAWTLLRDLSARAAAAAVMRLEQLLAAVSA